MPEVDRPPWGKLKLKHLVYEKKDRFIVFVDEDNDVDWRASDQYIQDNQQRFDECLGDINDAANAETLPCDNLGAQDAFKFKRLVGEAIARALVFDSKRAQKMIAWAKDFNRTRNLEVSRYWQLKYCNWAMAALLALALVVWATRGFLRENMGGNFVVLCLAFVAGGMGAYFSLASRMTTLATETGASAWLHGAESITRIATGGVSGVFATVAMRSGLVLANLSTSCGEVWGVLFVGMLAGLSERFVPSLIAKAGLPSGEGGVPGQPPAKPVAG